MHGKTSKIIHDRQGIFKDVPTPLEAMRYHSLVVYEPVPADLKVIASTVEGEIMALKHRQHPTYGVQFHPESILTEHGKQILKNFLDMTVPTMKGENLMLKPYIAKAINRTDLTPLEAEKAMNIIMTGQATPAQIGAYLVALRMKGETIAEITGSVRAMRAVALKVELADSDDPVYDIVGTGGDGAHTFNISTAAAFVLAGTGRKVAKHGNRAASSQCGSADVLAALGLNLDLTPQQVGKAIDEIGIGFMFAPKFHPAMKHAIGPRKEIGQRTIFNILGPLTNPAGAPNQVLGVFHPDLVGIQVRVLQRLGSKHVMTVYGLDGLDEISISGETMVGELLKGEIQEYTIHPSQFGLELYDRRAIQVNTVDESKQMVLAVLENQPGPALNIVLLNAGAAIYVAGAAKTLGAGIEHARKAIASGDAKKKLEQFVAYTQRLKTA
jgi:anthranilate phosphoribosyltransferase